MCRYTNHKTSNRIRTTLRRFEKNNNHKISPQVKAGKQRTPVFIFFCFSLSFPMQRKLTNILGTLNISISISKAVGGGKVIYHEEGACLPVEQILQSITCRSFTDSNGSLVYFEN